MVKQTLILAIIILFSSVPLVSAEYIVKKEYEQYSSYMDDVCVTIKNTGDEARFRVEIRSASGANFIAEDTTGYLSNGDTYRECVELTSSWQLEYEYTIVVEVDRGSSNWVQVDKESYIPTYSSPPPPSAPPPPPSIYSGYIVSNEYKIFSSYRDDICVTLKNTGDRAEFRVEIKSASGYTSINSDTTGYVSSDDTYTECVELRSDWELESEYTVVLEVDTSSTWKEVDVQKFNP